MNLHRKLSFLQKHPSKRLFLFSDQLGISLITDKPPFPFYWLEERTLSAFKTDIKQYRTNKPGKFTINFPNED